MPAWVEPVAHYMFHVGLPMTLRIAAYAVIGSVSIGIALGTLMTIRFPPLQGLIRLYIEIWRGLPIIVTIFLVYYALPTAPVIHHRFAAVTGAALGLTLWGSAQVAEATRGAVILPQALRRLLPPLVSLVANIIQNTTIASLIGVTELLATGQRSIERLQLTPPGDSHAFAIYGALLVLFFCISFPLTRLAIFLERRLV